MIDSLPFSSLSLSSSLLRNLDELGYAMMTPVQAESLPVLLGGQDLIAQAKTGSGKTAAFGIPLLEGLDPSSFQIQALVLCPTRELAEQVCREIRRLARMMKNIKVLSLCGGKAFGPQWASLEHGAHIVVGTPGRVRKHLHKGSLSLDSIQRLVLDEADRMLDMGFEEDMTTIIKACPTQRQTALFSATFPAEIQAISEAIQKQPVRVTIEGSAAAFDIEQRLYRVETRDLKFEALVSLLLLEAPSSCLVFCNMKRTAHEVAEALREEGFVALSIHGDLEQAERDEVWLCFANGSCTVLVATDVAARGLDVKELGLVVNFDLSRDPEVHVHRVGRTGRAGHRGLALSLVDPQDAHKVKRFEAYQKASLPEAVLPAPEGLTEREPVKPEMVTLCIDGGKKRKVRPGDILGALTKDAGLAGQDVGKIDIFAHRSYVAVHHSVAGQALRHLRRGKLKGRQFRARRVSW